MTEKEYRISLFDINFSGFKEKNIVLYGTGENARAILKNFQDYHIIGLMDKQYVDLYKMGKKVLSFREVLELETDIIIIAAQISSSQIVYKRICNFCISNHIRLFDMYGHDLVLVNARIAKQKINFYQRGENELKNEIQNHDVISFDIMDTLLMRKVLSDQDIFSIVESQAIECGIDITDFKNIRMEIEKKFEFKVPDLEMIYNALQVRAHLSNHDKYKLMDIELEQWQSLLIPRKKMVEVLQYAITLKKKIFLLSDNPLSRKILETILEKNGIKGYDKLLIGHENHCTKYFGWFRVRMHGGNSGSYLHIGDNEEADGIAPQMYDMDIFLIKDANSMLRQSSDLPIDEGKLEEWENRMWIGHFIAEVFNNPFALYNTDGKIKLTPNIWRELNEKLLKNNGAVPITYEPSIYELKCLTAVHDEFEKLKFVEFKKPRVSIIIPVYNQFAYTYNCLKSVLQYSGDITYEIIIGDDRSTDLTTELDKIVYGIKIIHNDVNMKFLLNCNNAARYAKGEFILFLNNDIQVQPGWLEPLVRMMDDDNRVGLVGSKLVYPDGRLQEAGGIIWSDGSGWNYGHNQNPELAEYNYVKEVDYISGASIMIRTSIWNVVGGFDEIFTPAYYEDVDLAFKVRKAGYKVIYQPESIVVHFEGQSNGTDLNSGLKKYQVVNRETFFQKWSNELSNEHCAPEQDVFLARNRSKNKKHILVVDHYVPHFDMDTGGRMAFMYLMTYIRKGFQVTFIGDNFFPHQPYTRILCQHGVEILYGANYMTNLNYWIKENGRYFDYVYFTRPHITIKYLDYMSDCTKAKFIYFGVDLHYLREYRQYELTKNSIHLKESEKWKNIEFEIIECVDIVHVVGNYEESILKKEFPHKIVRNIPVLIYDKLLENIPKEFAKRNGMIFVGGFAHPPNVDAVLWFANDIFPLILKKYPDLKWHIVGSKPPEEVQRLACDNIVIHGFVSDEELDGLYNLCRLAVVPLRFGAGVKGKVIEAAYYQIPLITTTIGAEGISMEEKNMIIEDDNIKMASIICDIYEDYDRLEELSTNCKQFIKKHYMYDTVEQVLGQDMIF